MENTRYQIKFLECFTEAWHQLNEAPELEKLYEIYCDQNGLDHISADELILKLRQQSGITKINPPRFTLVEDGTLLNEYELRQLQLEVARGDKPQGLCIEDAHGNLATIDKDGKLSNDLSGMSLADDIALEHFLLKMSRK